MKNYATRRGFTLVELLIVIVVIGILSAMMMLSSTEAVSSAKAADIISDLRNLKTAALAWYMDNLDEIETVESNVFKESDKATYDANVAKVWQYMGSKKARVDGSKSEEEYHYSFGSETHTAADWYGGAWYVWCKVKEDMKVREKLEARKATVGLVGAKTAYHGNPDNVEDFIASNTDIKYVGIRIK